MTSMSGAFRSHLMQQFASAARSQSRPPLALVGLRSSRSRSSLTTGNEEDRETCSIRGSGSSQLLFRNNTEPPRRLSSSALATESVADHSFLLTDKNLSVAANANNQDESSASTSSIGMRGLDSPRATVSSSPTANIKDALSLAVEYGLNAPNHHRSQAFSFKRMISPSETTERLAQIAYHVKLRKKPESEENRYLAERKRQKWSQIPGFLVTLVEGQPNQEPLQPSNDVYETLPFVGPNTEQQLEDYAAACAAMQNVEFALHAQGIGTKWATGPVTRTPAFRSLVGAQEDERVVGLVMVGHPMRVPRHRTRGTSEEVLEDL